MRTAFVLYDQMTALDIVGPYTAIRTASVCSGSTLLAKAGLLTGRRATSHWVARDSLAEWGAIVVAERVVVDGDLITSAGVSATPEFVAAIKAVLDRA